MFKEEKMRELNVCIYKRRTWAQPINIMLKKMGRER